MSALLIVEIYILIRSWKILLKSKNANFRVLLKIVSFVFGITLIWELIGFLQNENGKSFTIGWFALEFFLLNLFFYYCLFYWVLAKVSKRRKGM